MLFLFSIKSYSAWMSMKKNKVMRMLSSRQPFGTRQMEASFDPQGKTFTKNECGISNSNIEGIKVV